MSRFRKGDFTVIPNAEYIKGKHPGLRSVFMAICSYADSDGVCFPSRKAIMECSGYKDLATIDKIIAKLVEDGVLLKTNRVGDSGDMTSNEYQIMILDDSTQPIKEKMDTNTTIDINTPQQAAEKPMAINSESYVSMMFKNHVTYAKCIDESDTKSYRENGKTALHRYRNTKIKIPFDCSMHT